VTVSDGLPFPFFSFDTSAFINGQRDLFRPTTFGPLWDAIAKMIEAREILAVDEVKLEIRRKDDDVAKWVLSHRGLFVPLGHDIQKATKVVLAACPRLMAQHGANRNSADPFVVGLALAAVERSSPRRPRPTARDSHPAVAAAEPGARYAGRRN
jgi:hypothetical protein